MIKFHSQVVKGIAVFQENQVVKGIAVSLYPKMEVRKCCDVIKGIRYGLDWGLVFSSRFQQWHRPKRPQMPRGINLFSPWASLRQCFSNLLAMTHVCKSNASFPYYVLLWYFLIYSLLFTFKSSGQNSLSWLFEALISRWKPTVWETLC